MIIGLRIDPAFWRRWHVRLAERLGAAGHRVGLVAGVRDGGGVPATVDLLLRLEGLVYGGQAGQWFAADAPTLPPLDGPAGLVIDLTGTVADPARSPPVSAGPVWTVLFDGAGGDDVLVAALLAGAVPDIRIVAESGTIAVAQPASENPQRLGAGLDAVLLRAVNLLVGQVADYGKGRLNPVPAIARKSGPHRNRAPLVFGAATLASKVAQRLTKVAGAGHRWQTGWRALPPDSADAVERTFCWPAGGYQWLPDDGQRFYADPFVVRHGGRTVLFVEELPYRTGRGIISAVDLDANGPIGTPRPVLERPTHLSYPSVFARDGAIWMIPETAGTGTIELYRADPFPDRWVLDRVLVEGVSAGDATLLDHEGRLFLFCTTTEEGGSTWDQLSIYHAETLSGPWRLHGADPALIDAGAARPAGFPFLHPAAGLIRPVQDCRTGYGAGLGFCRIDALDDEQFRQTVVGRLMPDPGWRASGAHTLNTGYGFEVVDRIGPR